MIGAFECDAVNKGAWSLIRRSRLNQTIRGACDIILGFFIIFGGEMAIILKYLFIGFSTITKITHPFAPSLVATAFKCVPH